MEREVILRFVREHPGLTADQIVERLSDPSTEHVTREALAKLRIDGAVYRKMDGTYHDN